MGDEEDARKLIKYASFGSTNLLVADTDSHKEDEEAKWA